MRNEHAANLAMAQQARKPFKFTPSRPATRTPVVQETTIFNLVSDNALVNGLALAGSVAASVVVIALTMGHFFA